MKPAVMNTVKACTLVALGLAIAAMGIYVAEADDAPGAAVMGLLLMVAGVVLGVKAARNRLPTWAARTALAVGVVVAAFAALVTHWVVVTAPLFAQSQVPSVAGPATPPQYAAAVGRARELVRTAVRAQNLPGVSVAVGLSSGALAKEGIGSPSAALAEGIGSPSVALAKEGSLVWAEGFGWRDVVTQTPVTPETRFNIGTAASAVAPAVAPLGLTDTGADAAVEWSPEQIGEPGEDFPLFTLVRHLIFQPIGLAPAEYPLPDDRATFYVPRSDDDPRRGRRLMYMRDLACCTDGMAFSSTPSDLVRFAMATDADGVDGHLAGGMVMSLMTRRDSGIVVAVASNMAYANTSSLAQQVADAFAEQAR
jgi:hypothetical protein